MDDGDNNIIIMATESFFTSNIGFYRHMSMQESNTSVIITIGTLIKHSHAKTNNIDSVAKEPA